MPAWVLGAVPIVATVLPKGLVILLALIAVPAIVAAWRQKALSAMYPKWALGIAAVALAWMAFRAATPFDGHQTLTGVVRYAALIALGFAAVWWVREIPHAKRAQAGKAMVIGALISLVIVVVGAIAIKLDAKQTWFPIERSDRLSIFNTGVVALVLLGPGVAMQFDRHWHRGFALAYVAVTVAAAFLIGASTAYMTAFAGVVVALACLKFGRQVTHLAAILSVAAIVAFPVALPLMLDRMDVTMNAEGGERKYSMGTEFAGSLGHRYFIWRFALERAEERPFLGWGFDTSRSIPGGHKSIDWGKELMPLHPHNEILQVWLELGVPGLLILAAVIWYLFLPRGTSRGYLPGTEWVRTATVGMILVVGSVAFGVWQSWWVAALLLILATLYLCEKPAGGD